jgi:hypothetical protein
MVFGDLDCNDVVKIMIANADLQRLLKAELNIFDEVVIKGKMKPNEILLLGADIMTSAILTGVANCIQNEKEEDLGKCLAIPGMITCMTAKIYETVMRILSKAITKAGGLNKDVVEVLREVSEDTKLFVESYLGED